MNILQINNSDGFGGAEQLSLGLHYAYRTRGHTAVLAVGTKHRDLPGVVHIDNEARGTLWSKTITSAAGAFAGLIEERVRGTGKIKAAAGFAGHPGRVLDWWSGREHFGYPASRDLDSIPGTNSPDVIQAHNLHGGYFDLTHLPQISQRRPLVLTLHDSWLLSGHCAHSFSCDRWKTGCGNCPDLSIYPAIRRDATAANWVKKQDIYARSQLFVSTPCKWLMDKVDASILSQSISTKRVVPNGIDLKRFTPGDKQLARKRLGLPMEPIIIMFAANGIRKNMWKDYTTLQEAVGLIGANVKDVPLQFMGIGEEAPTEQLGQAIIKFVPYQSDPAVMADHYRAADIFLHVAKVDTFPTTVLEALACGTPTIASAVGGIPEQINHEGTGYLVKPGNAEELAARVLDLIRRSDLRKKYSRAAAKDAVKRFDRSRMAGDYLSWFEEILETRSTMK